MKIATLIPALVVALGIAGAAQAEAQAVASSATPTFETPRCYSNLSPYVCSAEEAELARLAADYRQFQGASDSAILPRQAKERRQNDAAQPVPVPEPKTFVMVLIGLVLLGFTSQRREEFEKFSD